MPKTATPDGPGERVALLSRTTIELRKQLEHAASLSGRSLGQEVERRLERTFDFDYLFGDGETALVLRTIATAVQRFEKASDKLWARDSETQELVHETVSKMVDVLLGVRQQNDDRKSTGVGLPVDWNDLHQRLRARLIVLEIGVEEVQGYIREKELEYLPVMREARGKSHYRVEVGRVRSILLRADRAELAGIAASLVKIPGEARVAQTQAGVVVSEQGLDGVWRPVSPEWHGAEPPPWVDDTAEDLRVRIEMMLNFPPTPVPAGTRQATPEEIANMKPARGQLPPEIGDQAIFDDAVAGLPLEKVERAAAAKSNRKPRPLHLDAAESHKMPAPSSPRRKILTGQ